jgi:transposase
MLQRVVDANRKVVTQIVNQARQPIKLPRSGSETAARDAARAHRQSQYERIQNVFSEIGTINGTAKKLGISRWLVRESIKNKTPAHRQFSFLAPHQHLSGLGRYVLRTGCQWRYLAKHFPPVLGSRTNDCMVGSELAFDSRCRTVIRDKRSVDVCGDDSVDAGSIGEKCVLWELVRERCSNGWTRGIGKSISEDGIALSRSPTMSVRCVLWSRQGFNGWEFTAWLKGTVKWTLELTSGISRPGKDDFKIAPKRWVRPRPVRCRCRAKKVERTIAWLLSNRRLARSFERLVESEEAFTYSCMTRLMLARL